MRETLMAIGGGFRAEIALLRRGLFTLLLVTLQAVTFLCLVSLFGLTGSRAPTALIIDSPRPYPPETRLLIEKLNSAHRSFDLRPMDAADAQRGVARGELVAAIRIRPEFARRIARGERAKLQIAIDNVDTDMTDDVRRALPSAIGAYGRALQLPGVRVHVTERDLVDHDTGFIPYLLVSGLILDAFVIACLLGGLVVAREFEVGTIRLLALAPSGPIWPLLGRALATATIASLTMLAPVSLVVWAVGVPTHLMEVVAGLLLAMIAFSATGMSLGALLGRVAPLAPLVLGLALPLYLCGGALEPLRFDGEFIWWIGHASPVYSAVGILEHAWHGLTVTPESRVANFLTLLAWTIGQLALAIAILSRRLSRCG